jgi:hypothetical protein
MAIACTPASHDGQQRDSRFGFLLKLALRGQQVDDAHDRGTIADIRDILGLAFDTGPNVAFLDGEGVPSSMVDTHLAIDALADHVIHHAVALTHCAGLMSRTTMRL